MARSSASILDFLACEFEAVVMVRATCFFAGHRMRRFLSTFDRTGSLVCMVWAARSVFCMANDTINGVYGLNDIGAGPHGFSYFIQEIAVYLKNKTGAITYKRP
ncbi:hypothetical protein DSUL_50445 [Desulfovibrionales bacterium]